MIQPVISTEKLSDDFLCINSCDCQRFSGIVAGSKRLLGRMDYHMLYIAQGTCYAVINGKETAVPANSLLLYLPYQPQIYSFKAEDISVSYYIHFCGTACEKILKDLNLYDRPVVTFRNASKIEQTFEKLIREFHTKRPFYELSCNGIFLNLLSEIARSASKLSTTSYTQNMIYDICLEMHKSYSENLNISHYAQMLNLSIGRFTHIFTQAMGISPKQYLLRIRFDHAIELLTNTDLSISQIAELVGIPDSNYFSRLFKKHLGHSPSFYR